MTALKKGISSWVFAPERPLPEVFRRAKETGFDGIEVSLAEQGPLTLNSIEADCDEVRSQAEAVGIELTSLACGLRWSHSLTTPNVSAREQSIEAVIAVLDIARNLGVGSILLVPGGVTASVPYDVAYKNALASLKILAPVAAEKGVVIGIENVWNKFLLSPRETRTFFDAIGSPFVRSYFDVGNVVVTGFPEQWVTILGERIGNIHFKDFKRSIGNITGFCDLGDGDVDWPVVVSALETVGYDGYAVAEFFNCEPDLPKISAAMDKILGRTTGGQR